MSADKKVYLGKGGKHFGPFTDAQLEGLRKSGEIADYGFIWDPTFGRWELLHDAPPPIPRAAAPKGERIEAVCHDAVTILSGHVEDLTDRGCFLVSEGHGSHLPHIGEGARVRLNLLDPRTGRTTSVLALMGRAMRLSGACRYEIRWDRAPEVLQQF